MLNLNKPLSLITILSQFADLKADIIYIDGYELMGMNRNANERTIF